MWSSAIDPQLPLIGQRIGKHRITRQIGQGGMGVVFEAVEERLGQRAAVKLLSQELTQDPAYQKYAARFLDEARALLRIQHPGIVKILHRGQLRNGVVYILMEYLEGETLASLLTRLGSAPLKPQQALSIARQISSALAAAHKKRILHRDIKPANIMLISDPSAPAQTLAKLIDFGTALFLDSPLRRTSRATLLGTPAYMSPEQCLGLDIDDATDVYALGVVLYEMLSGRRPFDGSPSSIVAAKLERDPVPLSEVNPRLPRLLHSLVDVLLFRDRNMRPMMWLVEEQLRQLEAECQHMLL
jgi:serine/threonine-protein kinase